MSSFTWYKNQWLSGDTAIITSTSNAVWFASSVFDGGRYYDGFAPDLDLHCARSIRSAKILGMQPKCNLDEIYDLAWQGIKKYEENIDLYIKPTFWADAGFITPDIDSTQFAMDIIPMPMLKTGFSACLSSLRRPTPECAPTDAKASCLYTNSGLALTEARKRGFEDAVMLDMLGNISEYTTSNIFIVKDDVISTPAPNGSFLNGITRQRVIKLLNSNGYDIQECRININDLYNADEIFSTGNYAKVRHCSKFENKDMQLGRVTKLAQKLYLQYASENCEHVISSQARIIAAEG